MLIKKDTRATSLFETDPSISNSDDSGQFNVVDSKDTRQFVKSIAKDAHRIGQDSDILCVCHDCPSNLRI